MTLFLDLLAPGMDRYLHKHGFRLDANDDFVLKARLGDADPEELSAAELKRCFDDDDYAGIHDHLDRVMLKNLLGEPFF
jgi:hypothetical protein